MLGSILSLLYDDKIIRQTQIHYGQKVGRIPTFGLAEKGLQSYRDVRASFYENILWLAGLTITQ